MDADDRREDNVLLAFLLTLGAGLATTIGAAVAFCAPVNSTAVLGIGLAISAGVMICTFDCIKIGCVCSMHCWCVNVLGAHLTSSCICLQH
jgi:hypothetical protein